MEAVLFNVNDKSEIAFLIDLAKKLGISATALTSSQVEDWKFAQKITSGLKTKNVSREDVIKSLGK